ncbi:uncharacterized protein LOC135835698 [Planococcus citri]|uniref:uncharacterized protein LOC135835698 n=1 Tax=Planococcus citri TaxID=170843 RepID=UPI0031F73D71
MEKIVLIAILLIYFLLITKQPVYCRDHRKHGHLSPYLEPPPPRSIRTIPPLHKRPPAHKSGHHSIGPPHKDHPSANSVLPNLSKWFSSSGKQDKEKAASGIASKSVLQTRSHDYAVEESKCNPCNSVPWIPIVGSHRPKQLDLGFDHQQHEQPEDFAGNSYYSSFNEMSSNLKPINVIPSPFPMYFGTPVYNPELSHNHLPAQDVSQNHYQVQDVSQNHFAAQDISQTFHGQDFAQNHFQSHTLPENQYQTIDWGHNAAAPVAGFGATWNAAPSYTASGSDNVHEPSLYSPQVGPQSGHVANHFNTSADPWLYESKVMPLSHYVLSVDHPLQIYQTPLLDVPSYQVPPSPGADLPLHVQNQVFQPTQAPAPVHEEPVANHFTSSTGADGTNDRYRPLAHNSLLDDAKYSSSESKFSSVGAEGNHVNDTSASTDFFENITSSLIEYLTPPNLSPNTNEEWVFDAEPETPKKKKQIQIVIPYTIDKSKGIQYKNSSSNSWSTERSLSQRLRDMWGPFTETTTPLPIVSYLKSNSNVSASKPSLGNPPKRQEWSDMLRLQKAIDTWTVEGYSNHKHKQNEYYFQKVIASTLPPSKEIPSDYLASTVSYLHVQPVHNFRGVRNQIPVIEEKMHQEPLHLTNSSNSKAWEKLPVSVSPLTKEKVYIVTPLPLKSYNFSAEGVVENWP